VYATIWKEDNKGKRYSRRVKVNASNERDALNEVTMRTGNVVAIGLTRQPE
jgi:hypothetical protein